MKLTSHSQISVLPLRAYNFAAPIQSLRWLFATPWTAISQASLFSTICPRVCSDSCSLSRWCYLTLSSSATLFSFCLQSFPASGSFPVSHLSMKIECFQIVVLEKTLEHPLDSKEIKPVNPKGNQPWIFIGRTDAEAPMLCYLMGRADSLGGPVVVPAFCWGSMVC